MTPTRPDPDLTPVAPTAGDEVALSTRTPGPGRLRAHYARMAIVRLSDELMSEAANLIVLREQATREPQNWHCNSGAGRDCLHRILSGVLF